MKRAWFLFISLAVVLADQLTKLAIRRSFVEYESVPVLGNLLRLTYIQNTGAAFSFSPGSPMFNRFFFSAVSLIAIIVLIWVVVHARQTLPALCYSLIIGGAAGNLIDRLRLGGVTDFLDADFPDFIMQRWPVFNLADSAIVVAIILLLIYTLFFERKHTSGDADHENPA
ncbi:MAG: signal peptidase II [Candidatus Cloacimonetes bacterium]|nr:signal peptidase II [Candidatus Cloacimonadota bacterium]